MHLDSTTVVDSVHLSLVDRLVLVLSWQLEDGLELAGLQISGREVVLVVAGDGLSSVLVDVWHNLEGQLLRQHLVDAQTILRPGQKTVERARVGLHLAVVVGLEDFHEGSPVAHELDQGLVQGGEFDCGRNHCGSGGLRYSLCWRGFRGVEWYFLEAAGWVLHLFPRLAQELFDAIKDGQFSWVCECRGGA